MKLTLTVSKAGGSMAELELDRECVRIGRARGCDVILDDTKVSSRHADIFACDGHLFVRDLRSTNGVFVNGKRVAEARLEPGDALRIGDSILAANWKGGNGASRIATTARFEGRTMQDPLSLQIPLENVEEGGGSTRVSNDPQLMRRKLLVLARLGKELARVGASASQVVRLAAFVREVVGPERLAILVPEGAGFAPLVAYDWRSPEPERPVFVPESFLRAAVEKSHALLSEDLAREPLFGGDPGVAAAPVHSAMVAPLLSGHELRAAIYVDRAAAENPFTGEDLHMLAVIANQGAVILENAQLFGDLRTSEQALGERNKALEASLEQLRVAHAELVQAAKLASIGELAAGVSHELNNPLAAILGYVQLLETDPALPRDAIDDLGKIGRQAGRMREIVQNLVSFARRDGGVRKLVDMKAVVRSTVEMLAFEIRKSNVKVELDLEEQAMVLGSMTELEQVVINIVHNAIHALQGVEGRTIRIATRKDGAQVRTSIADNGRGIKPEHLPRIFDPFFTTKPVGVGTGLGLSVSYGIISSHGGRLSASSEYGHGATFEILLPFGEERPAAAEAAPATTEPQPPSRRVLFVDDEQVIRECVSALFERAGHRVIAVADPFEALRILETEDFDVAIADMRMPGMSGADLFRRAVEARPALRGRFLFLTADTAGAAFKEFLAEHAGAVVTKPFEARALLQRVEDVAQRQHA